MKERRVWLPPRERLDPRMTLAANSLPETPSPGQPHTSPAAAAAAKVAFDYQGSVHAPFGAFSSFGPFETDSSPLKLMHRKCQRPRSAAFSSGSNFSDLQSMFPPVMGAFRWQRVFPRTGRAFPRYLV